MAVAAGDEGAGAGGVRVSLVIGNGLAGECSSARCIRALGPDATVLDSGIADGKGVQVCLEARESVPGLGCVVLVSYPDEAAGHGAGDCEFVLREVAGHGLVEAVRRAAAREDQ
ncbi:hypothetical protein SAT01_16990 [Sinomonas atrocyanea]|nr:hypothetical protein SAT01_16990 [Sinomonas atrocyanea]